jgi:hypothetical protein
MPMHRISILLLEEIMLNPFLFFSVDFVVAVVVAFAVHFSAVEFSVVQSSVVVFFEVEFSAVQFL